MRLLWTSCALLGACGARVKADWEDAPGDGPSAPTIGPDGTVYVTAGTAGENLAVVRAYAPDGELLGESAPLAGATGIAPTVAEDGLVYVPSGEAIAVLDSTAGDVATLPLDIGGLTTSIAIDAHGNLVAGGQAPNLLGIVVVVDPGGTGVWTADVATIPVSIAIGPDGTIHGAGISPGGVFALDANGAPLFTFAPEDAIFVNAIAVDHDSTTYAADLTALYALDLAGSVRWQLDAWLERGPTLGANGDLFAPTSEGLTAVDAATGEVRWSIEQPCGSVSAGADYRLYAICRVDDGNAGTESHLVVLDTDGSVQFETPLGKDGLGAGSPNMWDHRLYVSDDGSEPRLWGFHGAPELAATPWPRVGADVRNTARSP